MTSTMHRRAGSASGAPVSADIDRPYQPTPKARASAREWTALAVLLLPVLLVAVVATVLSFALPSIPLSLTPTGSQLLWIVDVYPLVLAGLLVSMGSWRTASDVGGCC